jgi:membrane-associated phospholipid phosphatase
VTPEVAGADTLRTVDRTVFLWVVEHRVGWLDPFFVALSVIGYAGLVWVGLAPLVGWLARRNLFFALGLTATCVWAADLVALGIKAATARPRPFETIPQADPLIGATVGLSLPSGHASTSFAGAVVLTYLMRRAAPYVFLLATAIAFSRVYVGVHYLSDVLAGAALGAAVALAALALLRLRRPTSTGRPRSGGAPPGG